MKIKGSELQSLIHFSDDDEYIETYLHNKNNSKKPIRFSDMLEQDRKGSIESKEDNEVDFTEHMRHTIKIYDDYDDE